MNKPKYKLSIEPTIITSLQASVLAAVFLNPISTALSLIIFEIVFNILLFLVIDASNLISMLIIFCLFSVFILLVLLGSYPIIAALKILMNKNIFLQKVDVEFYDDYYVGKREGIESKISYNQISKLKTFGKFIFVKHLTNSYIYNENKQTISEIYNFLNSKLK